MRPRRAAAQRARNDENENDQPRVGAKRREPPPGPSLAAQRPRRGGPPPSAAAGPAAALVAAQAPAPRMASPSPLSAGAEDEAEALLQLAVLGGNGAAQNSSQGRMQALLAGQQHSQTGATLAMSSAPISATADVHGNAAPAATASESWPLAQSAPRSAVMARSSAPISRSKSEEAEAGWLAAMGLTPLADLRQLGDVLDAPALGWLGVDSQAAVAMAVRASPDAEPTPAAFVRVCMGTPPSQALGLPHPSALDFGGPSIPHAAPGDSGRKGAAPAAVYLRRTGEGLAAAAAADGGNRPLHPQSSSWAGAVPTVVMALPLGPAARQGQNSRASLVPGVASLPQAPPLAVATAAAFARGSPPPLGCIVLGAAPAAAGTEALLPADAAAAAAEPPHRMRPGLPPVGSSQRVMLRRAQDRRSQDGHGSDSRLRLRRQRYQQRRSAEYASSDSEEEQEAASSSDDEEWGHEEELSETLLLADSAGAWCTPNRPSLTSASPASGSGASFSAGSTAPNSGSSRKGGSACSKTNSSKGSSSKPGASKGSTSKGGSSKGSTSKGGSNKGSTSKRGSSKGSTSKGGSRLRHSSSTPSLQRQLQQGSVKKQLDELVHLAAPEAATAMGLSLHNFRMLCRGVGIQRWTSRRPTSTAAGQD